MNIRYFFIASAVTSGLALAIQSSDSIANKQPSPIVASYTVYETDSQLLKPVSNTSDTLNILEVQSNDETQTEDTEALYQKGTELLSQLSEFLRTLFMLCIQAFLAGSGGDTASSSS
ncbi:hypothetical protein [Bartonella taylorii]|uniref:hypothetical protein n=1 Tax=Bartonella taylorii TaxID=33046 RepID=UPI001ABA4060|nr:hypothetical protein [Bartonella taylorii]